MLPIAKRVLCGKRIPRMGMRSIACGHGRAGFPVARCFSIYSRSERNLSANHLRAVCKPRRMVSDAHSQEEEESSSADLIRRKAKLGSIVEVDQLKNMGAEDIKKVWLETHRSFNGLSATLDSKTYKILHSRTTNCPRFVFPLPQPEGFLTMFVEVVDDAWLVTTIDEYIKNGYQAIPLCVMHYYNEFQSSKDLILMRGEVDAKRLPLENAQFIAHQLQVFYLDNQKYETVKKFNHQPSKFDFNEVVEVMKNLV